MDDSTTVEQGAFLTKKHCYIVRKIDDQLKEIVQRVLFNELAGCEVLTMRNSEKGAVGEFFPLNFFVLDFCV
jgi:uncharacterized protein YaaR (DUF327 family)